MNFLAIAESGSTLMSWLVIIVGMLAAALFFFYFLAESDKRKAIYGTLLALILSGFSIYCIKLGVKKGIDLEGGASFLVEVKPGDGRGVDAGAMDLAKTIIEKRLNPLGSRDVNITPQGENKLYVEVPGISDSEIRETEILIKKVAKLELRLLHEEHHGNMQPLTQTQIDAAPLRPGYAALEYMEKDDAEDENPTDAKAEAAKEKKFFWAKNKSELPGRCVANAVDHPDPKGTSNMISVELESEFDDTMLKLTSANIGKPMAIVLDGKILSAPSIEGPFGKTFQITGSFNQKEAADLSNSLKNPLENPLEIASSSKISPTYGKATVDQGINSALGGLTLTLVFMMFYYRLSGIIAVLGLVINFLLLLGAMRVFDFTLTMPGIAGMILTLGMAIDANVLIYERMREEFAAGRSFKEAINASYDKAFSAIFDSNITTLITSVIMMLLASGAIYGFGLSLTIGLICSMFSALVITRVFFLWLAGRGLKKLNFLSMIQNRLYDFMGKRRLWLTISAMVCALCVGIVAVKGKGVLGFELAGGDKLTLSSGGITLAEVEESLKDWTFSKDGNNYDSKGLHIGSENIVLSGSSNVIVRSPAGADASIRAELSKDLGGNAEKAAGVANASLDTMGPSIGGALLDRSILAIILGLVGIFIYLTFRFEMPFAVGGIVAIFHDVIIAVGVCALCGKEIGLILIGAFLTIAGYSINDTIVIFDRVRENLRKAKEGDELKDVLNLSISETLSRTVITSGVTGLAVLAMLVFGGKALGDFSFAMLVGMISGTYSTIFIASPVVLWWANRRRTDLRQQILDADAVHADIGTGIEKEAPSTLGKEVVEVEMPEQPVQPS